MKKLIPIKLFVLSIFLSLSVLFNNVYALGIDQQVAGKVNFFTNARSQFDEYTYNPSIELQEWMNTHYDRMLTYTPYFDSRLSWYPNALVYRDTYAIYKSGSIASDHPEWIMRDAEGNKLYIPFGCRDGSCPQYAGDFSNPEFRQYMVDEFVDIVSRGYRGLWLDDVNLTWRVGDGNGKFVAPIDYSTGQAMTLSDWQRHMAEYMEEIRAALPNTEISHNVIWYADRVENENPFIARQIDAADFINLERGGNDSGLKNGLGKFGYESYLLFNDYVHSRGANLIIMDFGKTIANREYGLATWLLMSEGKDLFHNNQIGWTSPDSWWHGYELNLGNALGPRYKWGELLRRDFECGVVILNQPRLETQSIDVGASFTNLDGEPVSSLELVAKSAAILLNACDSSNNGNDDGELDIQEPTTISFQNGVNGYMSSQDTVIDDSSPDSNFNSSSTIELDGSPKNMGALMYWDISDISPDATVESVEITLFVTNRSKRSYEIYKMKQPWLAEQATWNGFANGATWSSPGAQGSTDRSSEILAKIYGTSQGSHLTVNLGANGVALIQSWIYDPASNNGFIFMDYSASDGLDFYSSEATDSLKRPKLTIIYREN